MSVPPESAPPSPSPAEPACPFRSEAEFFTPDRAALLARFAGDADFFDEIAGVFLDDWPRMLGELHTACRQRDFPALRSTAHSVKGAVSHFTDEAPYGSAARVEQLAAAERPEAFDEALQAVTVLHAFVTAVAAAHQAPKAPPETPWGPA